MSNQEAFWSTHYQQVFQQKNHWLDYSNAKVQAQTFALCLEAAGPVEGKSCLDVGCGWGQFSTCLASLRASAVLGMDIVESAILEHRERYPQVRWECGSPTDDQFVGSLGTFDLIFLLESIQYFDARSALSLLWTQLNPGGRMVVVTPNAACPISAKVQERFQGAYAPPTADSLSKIAASLYGVATWKIRGLHFGSDQSIVPYQPSPWGESSFDGREPNRLQFVMCKQS